MQGDDPRRTSLAAFYAELLHDLQRGAPPPVERYAERFPDQAVDIRAEYEALLAQARAELARADPAPSTSNPISESDEGSPSMRLVRVLGEQRDVHGHYEDRAEIARGGMGAIVEVWDEHLRRALAKKVILRSDSRSKAMFIEEAQVTGRLDHPGIVPVHELGMDSGGRLYFTMRLVKGQTLKSVFEHVQQGDPEWSQVRVLDVLLKVCDAMAYAHAKGVVHRDLKPANVMVGRFGEVYVMDWGLARVLGKRDRHDLRLRPEAQLSESSIRTLRDEDRDAGPDSPLVTMEGQIVGTPAYMPPEQADGRVEELGPRSDVYSVGAMLYHLLAGRVPYTLPGGRTTSRTVLAMLLLGPPHPLHQVNPKAQLELVAICEKAMSRDPARRYADMREMAADLRAYVEHRVVRAYETGALAESRKWVRRNPLLAASIAGVVLLSIAVAVVQADGRRTAERERGIAEEHARHLSVLSDTALVAQLEHEAQDLWPIHPRTVPALQAWLARAHDVAGRTAEHEARLAELRAQALPYTAEERRADAGSDPLVEELESLEDRRQQRTDELEKQRDDPAKQQRVREGIRYWEDRISESRSGLGQRRTWRFADPKLQLDHDDLGRVVAALHAFADPSPFKGRLADVEQRCARSLEVETRSIGERRELWDRTCAAIADASASPAYHGLALKPQAGLVPLGRDPDSGLFEFAVLYSGDVPERDAQGRLHLTDGMAVVLVLVPGGEFWLGAQKADSAAPNFDAQAEENESPVRMIRLRPFFMSKFELTQAQWMCLCGERSTRSQFDSLGLWAGPLLSRRHPLETMTWGEAGGSLRRVDLVLPTEAQWEYCARAGTQTPWCTGATLESIAGCANVPDRSALDAGEDFAQNSAWATLVDGYPFTAPVGTYRPNAFGLHDVCGNVAEWCRDLNGTYDQGAFDPGDGMRSAKGGRMRVVRGGSFYDSPIWQRSAKRQFGQPTAVNFRIGVRPARAIEE